MPPKNPGHFRGAVQRHRVTRPTLCLAASCLLFVVLYLVTASSPRRFTLSPDDCNPLVNFTTTEKGTGSSRFPVVFTYFTSSAILPESYVWVAIHQALRHHADVVLISNATSVRLPVSLVGRASLVDMAPLISASPRLLAFHNAYQPWGLKEPWEEENFSRFYVLSTFMAREGISYAFFGDTDVALNAPIPIPPFAGCDAMVMFRDRDASYDDPFNWMLWAGTSILSRGVLEDFTAFVLQMYAEPYLSLLRRKRDAAPFVCDMTLWYFYVAAADPSLRAKWHVSVPLPSTPPRRFCSSAKFGYNNMIGDLDNGLQCPPPIRSIHFQGSSKDLMKTYAGFAPGRFDSRKSL